MAPVRKPSGLRTQFSTIKCDGKRIVSEQADTGKVKTIDGRWKRVKKRILKKWRSGGSSVILSDSVSEPKWRAALQESLEKRKRKAE